MQTDEVEYELSPSILDTPSLMTPNIVLTASTIRSTYNPLLTHLPNNNGNPSISNPSSTTNQIASSADVKVSKIEDELKQSLAEPRRPTPSPFQKISRTNIFILDKPPVINNDDGTTIEVPSTADVVKDIEEFTNTNPLQFPVKTVTNDNNERGTTINDDSIRYDSPPIINMGVSPPKKKFLIRSQSHTEQTSPIPNNNNNNNNNNNSQSQKNNNDDSILNTQNGLDDENSMDDSVNNHFTRAQDLPSTIHHHNNQQFKSTIDNRNEQHLNLQLRTDQNNISHSIIKQQQQPIVINNKRTFQPANIGNNISSLTKANTIIIPQSLNEVTSTDQSSPIKRQRTTPISTNTTVMNFRPSFPSTSSSSSVATVTNALTTNGSNANSGSDDQRKKQIRDSNREAARRCRERRRNYIEQLEGNLEHHKGQIKQLTEKLARIERENTQLRAILTETKILHSSSRLSVNESHGDYANVITTSGMDLNSESNHHTDGGTISRNYLNRNNL